MLEPKNTNNILITRSKNDSLDLLENVNLENFDIFFEPIFESENISYNFQENKFSNSNSIIVTSFRSLAAVMSFNFERNIKIFAVGKKTAETFAKVGFTNISYPEIENALELKKLIIKHQQKPSSLLYFHGSEISLDFKDELELLGYNVTKILAYKIIPHQNFSDNLISIFQQKKFDSVAIFSKKSGEIFHNLCLKHNLLEYFKSAQIFCLSKNISQSMENLGFKNCFDFSQLPQLLKK